jgi:hypothetical protein
MAAIITFLVLSTLCLLGIAFYKYSANVFKKEKTIFEMQHPGKCFECSYYRSRNMDLKRLREHNCRERNARIAALNWKHV